MSHIDEYVLLFIVVIYQYRAREREIEGECAGVIGERRNRATDFIAVTPSGTIPSDLPGFVECVVTPTLGKSWLARRVRPSSSANYQGPLNVMARVSECIIRGRDLRNSFVPSSIWLCIIRGSSFALRIEF
jgi:hypothetical protein